MKIREDLQTKIFQVIERILGIKVFEQWLYAQDDLAERMSESFYFTLFDFNYNQKDVVAQFKSQILPFFDQEEFMGWKIKEKLKSLIQDAGDKGRILNELWHLSWEEYPFLKSIGEYSYCLEDTAFCGDEAYYTNKMKKEAEELLSKILLEEQIIEGFKISEFPYRRKSDEEKSSETTQFATDESLSKMETKKWWQFW